MTSDEIQAVLSVYRFRNYSDAANQNAVSPSTLSKQIAHVEQELGVKLFNRATKKKEAELTAAGKAILPYFEQMSVTMAETKVIAKSFQKDEVFDFRIGYQPSIGTMGEAKLYSSFIVNNPDIKLHFIPEKTGKLIDYLYSGFVDVLIINIPEWDLMPESAIFNKLYNPAIELIELRRCSDMLFEVSRDSDVASIDVIDKSNLSILYGKTFLFNNWSPYINHIDRIREMFGVHNEIDVRYLDFDKPGLVHTILLDNPDFVAPFIGTQTQRQYLWKIIPFSDWHTTTYQYLAFLKSNKSRPLKSLREEVLKYTKILDTIGIVLKGL